MTLEEFLSKFAETTEEADGWLAVCPAHEDSHPSLRIAVGERGVLLKCRAGCATADVLKAADSSFAELSSVEPGTVERRARSTSAPAGPAAVAALAVQLDRWADEFDDGNTIDADALSYAERRFGLTRDDVRRLGLGLATDLGGGPRLVVPFRDKAGVPRGYQARALAPDARVRWLGAKSPDGASWSRVAWLPGESGWSEVIVTEGPGDGLTACATGYDTIAVRGAGLAGSVADEIAEMAAGHPVVVVGDADAAGDRFTRTLAAELAKRGLSVRKVRPPRDGDDLTDWRGRSPETFATEFVRAVGDAHDPGGLRTRVDAWTDADATELAAARKLKEHFEARDSGVRYSPEAGFFILRDGVWRPDALEEVRTSAQEVAWSIWAEISTLKDMVAELSAAGSDREAKALGRRLGALYSFARRVTSSQGISAMIRELQALRGVAADVNDFDRHHHLLAVRNGVIDLRTGELTPHDPAHLLTRRVDVDFDPDATAPRWEQFLREVFPRRPELPDFMRRLVGYGITGETAEQCFAVLWGTGANGKSVFTDTLTEVFRELSVTTPFATFEEKSSGGIPNDLAALKGSRLVFAAEGEQGRPMAEAILKRVTGRDLISARFMRREFFEFRPTFLLMLATNFKPAFRGQDEGLWRRVKLIPWERYFKPSERDHKLGETLRAEAAGILAWAVRGAGEWYRDGLNDPTDIQDATTEYRELSDVLNGFLPGVFIADENGEVLAKHVFDAFQVYADEGNYMDLKKWSLRALNAALEERGHPRRKTNRGQVVVGIRRARATDAVPNHAEPEVERTPTSPLAYTEGRQALTRGQSLDDVLGG